MIQVKGKNWNNENKQQQQQEQKPTSVAQVKMFLKPFELHMGNRLEAVLGQDTRFCFALLFFVFILDII